MRQRPLRRNTRQKKDPRTVATRRSPRVERMNGNAAGIDVGAAYHWVAVPDDRDAEPVQRFATFTVDLYALADWLTRCGIETVVMESTGVYGIPVFEVLEERGFAVSLVDPHHVKQVPGRKTDVQDCQWLQELHTYGLLRGAFRPAEAVCVLRSYLRQRSLLIEEASRTIQPMQKALEHMNLKLTEVVSAITGHTGMGIIRAILAGERDPQALAVRRDRRCKRDQATIAKALEGTWRQEHLFALGQAVAHDDFTQHQLTACDAQIEAWLPTFANQVDLEATPLAPSRKAQRRQGNAPAFDVRLHLYKMSGVDLTRIDGIDALTAWKLLSEIGLDMTRWPTVKHFASWLGLCPGNKITGGKRYRSPSKPTANRAAAALRMAAQSLSRSQSALGASYRRMRSRLGAPAAITATAHKLARLLYSMLRYGTAYVDMGQAAYERRYQDRVVKNLHRKAHGFGFRLIPIEEPSTEPAPVATRLAKVT